MAAVIWGLFAWRAITLCVILIPDTLVMRNILATKRVPFVDISDVRFARGRLTVSTGPAVVPEKLYRVTAGTLGPSNLSGRRVGADALADAIAVASGLPALPPRRQNMSGIRAWGMLAVGALCLGVGTYYGPIQYPSSRVHPAMAGLGGAVLVGGTFMLFITFRVIRDYHFKRSEQPGIHP